MAGQLLPPPGMEPRNPPDLTPAQRLAVWCDLIDAGETLRMAGLRHRVGPDGDLEAAYRESYERQLADHEAALIHIQQELRRRSKANGS